MAVLDDAQIEAFGRDGWIVVPDVVPESLLVEVDEEVARHMASHEPQEGNGGAGPNLWFPPVADLPRCDGALRSSGALAIAEELVTPHRLDHAFDHIQIANTVPPHDHLPGGPHIDGHGPGQDPPGSFTMLAGILLTDQTADRSGNLWVWPGSHLAHERLFHERGTRVLMQTFGHSTMLDPPAELAPPIPVRGRRGDLLLAHFLLGHNKGANTSDTVRRTVYHRLAASGHRARWESTFLDALAEYGPVARRIQRP